VDELAEFLAADEPRATGRIAPDPAEGGAGPVTAGPLCITGMACRFPDADSVDEFWLNLRSGRDSCAEFPGDRLTGGSDPQSLASGYTTRGAFMRDAAGFDGAFFGISPREAARMDPRQRILLEISWQAMEDSGLTVHALRGSRTGVFLGMMEDGQFAALHRELGAECLDDAVFGTGTAGSVAAGRLSYQFDLIGPAVVVDTACSSSLVALHLAMRAIAAGDCDRALVAAASLTAHPDSIRQACAMQLLAADGRTKAFDAAADGFLLGEGVAAVLVERLGAARNRGARVRAVLRGSAVNQDGATNGLTAPSRASQVDVVRRALAQAALEPGDVDYVEAHGTGTTLGDAIESAGLAEVFLNGPPRRAPLAVGAVKTNVGHLTATAGMAGLIKTVLAVETGHIPANLHLSAPSTALGWDPAAVVLPNRTLDWPTAGRPRRASVSSFGWSGTNAHVVLEEAATAAADERTPAGHAEIQDPGPAGRGETGASDTGRWHAVLVSARTPAGVGRVAADLEQAMAAPGAARLADVAYTTRLGRSALEYRAAIVAQDTESARRELAALAREPHGRRARLGDRFRAALLLPGTGDQYPGLGSALYEAQPAYRDAIDLCLETAADTGVDVARWLYPRPGTPAATPVADLSALLGRGRPAESSPLTDLPEVAHAAVFALDYAAAVLWRHLGVEPDAVLGYSLGEYAAAAVAGVFDPRDALRLVIERARLIAQAPPGVMLTVAAPASRLAGLLGPGLDLAADNGPLASVAAGTEEEIVRLESLLLRHEIAHRRIPTPNAMHSRLMLPVRSALVELVRGTRRRPPALALVSNLTGRALTAAEATDPEHWGDHMCRTVRLADAVDACATQGVDAFIDAGSGQLSSLVTQTLTARANGTAAGEGDETPYTAVAVGSLPPRYRAGADEETLLRTIGRLWEAGAGIDWSVLGASGGHLAALPGYPFQHRRYWPSAPVSAAREDARSRPDPEAADGIRLYEPTWQTCPQAQTAGRTVGPVLVFCDDETSTRALADAVEPELCVFVRSGPGFAHDADGFRIRPTEAEDHTRLFEQLRETGQGPKTVVWLWSATADRLDPAATPPSVEQVRADQRRGFLGLLALGRTLPSYAAEGARVLVVTAGAAAVRPGEAVRVGRATITGPALTIPQEHPGIAVRTLDLPLGGVGGASVGHIAAELRWPGDDPAVAIRDGERMVRRYRAAPRPRAALAPLRKHGVYLITGGLGRIGLLVAAHLAERVQARLVLTGRSGLPQRERWAELTAGPDTETARRVRAVLALEEAGAEVMVAPLDAANHAALATLIERIEERFGSLDGVVHAAGTTGSDAFAPVDGLDAARARAHFDPKVYGTLALDEALGDRRLDFRVSLSSMSAVLGGVGFAAYAAANAFLDLFAEARPGRGPWTAIDWDTWRTTLDATAPGGLNDTFTRHSIDPADGVALFEELLGRGPRFIAAAGGALERRVRQWATPGDPFAAPEPAVPDDGAPGTAQTAEDRAGLAERPDLAVAYLAPRTAAEHRVARLWSQALGIGRVGVHDNFFDLGGNSLVGMQLVSALVREYRRPIPTVALFEAPTIATLAAYLEDAPQSPAEPDTAPDAAPDAAAGSTKESGSRTAPDTASDRLPAPDTAPGTAADSVKPDDIAIIGMAGRFPGADDVQAFWRNLVDGIESITVFPPEELRAQGVSEELLAHPGYIPSRPVLRSVGDFDAEFFGYTPWEAALTDPQQRLFLECVWECLEDGGYAPRSTKAPVGVFAGANISTYLLRLAATPQALAGVDDYQLVISNDKDALTLNASYRLDLGGPSVTVQSFCSTSLLAVHLACRSLVAGECAMAVAGGVSVRVPDRVGYLPTPGGMDSMDGHIRAFDADAGGAVFGDGCAVVLLKPLRRALADGDRVVAVIRGSAANNDGSAKVGFSAPSVRGQAEAVARAYSRAGVDPRTVGYIEAHGTGTRLGDPIEVAALTRVFAAPAGASAAPQCRLGSVKTNIGHLDRAAGAAGLIKAALALQNRVIPASLNFHAPNPEIDFAHSPFRVNAETTRWERADGTPLRAGVNSLGMGGTNVHVVLEEAPARRPDPAARAGTRRLEALIVSARTPESLDAARRNLARHLAANATEQGSDAPLLDAAYTLQTGREAFEYRLALLADGPESAATLLRDPDEHARAALAGSRIAAARVHGDPVVPVFAFSEAGDGIETARLLYASDPELRGRVDELGAGLPDLLALLAHTTEDDVPPREATRAGLLVQYAIAAELERCGVRPGAVAARGDALPLASAFAGCIPLELALGAVPPTAAQSTPAPRYPLLDETAHSTRDSEAAMVLLQLWPDSESRPTRERWAGEVLDGRQVLGPPENADGTDFGIGRVAVTTAWLAALWLRGVEVDWAASHAGRRPLRTSLPTYPFKRSRYWIDPPCEASSSNAATALSPHRFGDDGDTDAACADPARALADLPVHPPQEWFWRPGWRSAPELPDPVPADLGEPWLLFADTSGLARRTAAALRAAGGSAITVEAGTRFEQTGPSSFLIDPDDSEHYLRLLESCREHGHIPRVVAHFWSLDTDAHAPHPKVADQLLRTLVDLIRALGADGVERRLRIITSGVYRITGDEPLAPARAVAVGPALVTPVEYPNLDTRLVDMGRPTPATRSAQLKSLIAELADGPGAGRRTALRGGLRWIHEMRRLQVPAETPAESAARTLRERGVYLVTGGLGGIGLAIAQRLAASCAARLVLVGRAGLPAPERWDDLLADPACPADLARRICAVRDLRYGGTEVEIVAADVSDPSQARAAVRAAVDRFARLDGVVHAAGLPGNGLMATRDPGAASAVLAPKVAGTAGLLDALEGLAVDFVALFSSIAALTGGGPGQVDYSGANAYLDAVANAPRRGPRIVSIDWAEWRWNGWQDALAGFGERAAAFLRANRERVGISFDDGWTSFLRALTLNEHQVAVSPQDLPALAALAARLTLPEIAAFEAAADDGPARPRHPRPRLTTPYEPPPPGLAAEIAQLWGAALGLEKVGMRDDFFELGGNSLLAVGLIARIGRTLGGPAVPPHVLYQTPTVEGLVQYLQADAGEAASADGRAAGKGSAHVDAAAATLAAARDRGSRRREHAAGGGRRRT
jgi:acyl transferase domain-containing protein